VVDNESVSG